MSSRQQSKGTCTYCGKELSKGGMSKHLKSCAQRQATIAKAEKKDKPEALYHLRVQDANQSQFWLDLEMRGSKSLKDLDNYLRAIWLECCGHLSEFLDGTGSFAAEVGKSRKIEAVFNGTDTLLHLYDMGTTSETIVKCVDVRTGTPTTSRPIVLMARNLPPVYACQECGQPATHLCMECVYEDEKDGWLCDDHTENHPHKNYGEPLPLMNSPRTGMCGYTGPDDPPY